LGVVLFFALPSPYRLIRFGHGISAHAVVAPTSAL
jgi:hypothetical protein